MTKRNSNKLVVGAILVGMAWGSTATWAANDAEIVAAINGGLANLASTQTSGGYWNYNGYEQAATGAAAFAFLSQQGHWGTNAAAYGSDVTNAINYLLGSATTTTVSTRNDGVNICPGGSGSCTGVYWYGSGESTYTTGLVAPAIALYAKNNPNAVATTSGPLANMTWSQIAQGITNMFAEGQTARSDAYSFLNGGWRYYPAQQDSDMSTTQWAILSMIYDQTLGATTPGAVKTSLANWLAYVQAPGQGGAGCYQGAYNALCDHSDTGGLLLGLNFLGKTASDPAVQAALNFLNTNWQQGASGTWYGNFGHPYAMWSVYKGLETTLGLNDTTFNNLLNNTCSGSGLGTPTSGICNWWQDYNQWLVANQNLGGSWTGYANWVGPLATAFDVSILGGTVVPNPTPTVPEPATLSLFALALMGLVGVRSMRGV
jgi:hypothetical protein